MFHSTMGIQTAKNQTGRNYRTKDLISSINNLQEKKRKRKTYRLMKETQRAYQPMAMCGHYLDLNFFSDYKELIT